MTENTEAQDMTLGDAEDIFEFAENKYMAKVSFDDMEEYFKEITHGSSRVVIEKQENKKMVLLTADNDAVGAYSPNYLKALKLLYPERPLYLSPPIEQLMKDTDEVLRMCFCKIPNNTIIVIAPKTVNQDERTRGLTR